MLNCQRIYLRIMYKNKWIDEHKLDVAMEQIYEIGQILGGLIKYYAKNYQKCADLKEDFYVEGRYVDKIILAYYRSIGG